MANKLKITCQPAVYKHIIGKFRLQPLRSDCIQSVVKVKWRVVGLSGQALLQIPIIWKVQGVIIIHRSQTTGKISNRFDCNVNKLVPEERNNNGSILERNINICSRVPQAWRSDMSTVEMHQFWCTLRTTCAFCCLSLQTFKVFSHRQNLGPPRWICRILVRVETDPTRGQLRPHRDHWDWPGGLGDVDVIHFHFYFRKHIN